MVLIPCNDVTVQTRVLTYRVPPGLQVRRADAVQAKCGGCGAGQQVGAGEPAVQGPPGGRADAAAAGGQGGEPAEGDRQAAGAEGAAGTGEAQLWEVLSSNISPVLYYIAVGLGCCLYLLD